MHNGQPATWCERDFRKEDVTCDMAVVSVRATGDQVQRAQEILRASAIEISVDGAQPETDADAEFANYGSDGGPSQWGQRVLRVEGDQAVVADRTLTRDKGWIKE